MPGLLFACDQRVPAHAGGVAERDVVDIEEHPAVDVGPGKEARVVYQLVVTAEPVHHQLAGAERRRVVAAGAAVLGVGSVLSDQSAGSC